MDTKVAGQVAKQMAQFFKVFKDVEEVLEVAAQAENLKGEREKQIAGLTNELARLEGAVREARALLEVSKTDHANAVKAQDAALKELKASADAAAKARQEKADKLLAETNEALALAQKAHAEFMEWAAAEHADAEKSIRALQKQLEGLKAKVAAL